MTNNCKNKNCGCLDKGLTTGTPCGSTFACPDPDQCPETFSDCCVVHTGDSIVELGINKNERLCDILQRMILYITNPGCVLNAGEEGACSSPIGLHSITVTTSTISVGWVQVPGAVNGYQVEYKAESAMAWFINPAIAQSATPIDTIGGLLPDTNYYIRVRPICEEASSCYSVTIIVKTKAVL